VVNVSFATKVFNIMQAFKRFLLLEVLFTAFVSLGAYVIFSTIFSEYYLSVFWILLGLVAILTAVFHYSIVQIQEKQPVKFATRFMMVTGIKMMIYLVFITSYAFLNPDKAKAFLISFLILYLLYTVFEVILIVRYLKRRSKK
jgi:hypothetical protein